MRGISFLIDVKGKKTAAVIDLRRHRKLLEDFFDTALVQSRADEPRESLAAVKRRLKLPQPLSLTQAQHEELDRRLEDNREHPESGSPWEEVKRRILGER